MVTIEEEVAETTTAPVAEEREETHGTAANAQDASEAEGWRELMGKDLMMKTLEEVSSSENATALNHQDLVLVDFVGRAAPSPNDSGDGPIFHKATDWWIVIGDKDVLPALEMGIRFANVGETIAVWSKSKYAYGLSTRQFEDYELPPESSVYYEIKVKLLVSSEERSSDHLKWTFTVADSKKNIGNDAYGNEWSGGQGKSRINYLYQKAAKELSLIVDGINPTEEETRSEEEKEAIMKAKALLIDCLNNVTAVHLRAKEYHEAKAAAVKVLERDPSNFKALIRAAKAALLDPASSYEEVELAISAAAEKADSVQEKDLQKLRADFQRRKKAYEQDSKSMYSKALGGDRTKQNKEEQAPAGGTEKDSSEDMAQSPLPEFEDEKKPFSWSDRSTWPWSSIMAYLFQLSLPFIMLAIAQRFRDTTPGAKPRSFFDPPSTMGNSEPDPLQQEEF